MTYLLDTNVWVSFLRNPHSGIVVQLRSKQPEEICLCSVVIAELQYGCLCSAKPEVNRAQVQSLIRPYRSLPFDDTAAEQFAVIRRHLDHSGTPIGPYDVQIAAIALTQGCTLVTHNTQEFGRIPGLPLEDWELAGPRAG